MNDGGRFDLAASKTLGKRLTFDQLTGRTESPVEQLCCAHAKATRARKATKG
jgi:hypothetical protein